MKEQYQSAEMEVVTFDCEDIITTSDALIETGTTATKCTNDWI